MDTFSTRIKELRKQHNLTQEQLDRSLMFQNIPFCFMKKGKITPMCAVDWISGLL